MPGSLGIKGYNSVTSGDFVIIKGRNRASDQKEHSAEQWVGSGIPCLPVHGFEQMANPSWISTN